MDRLFKLVLFLILFIIFENVVVNDAGACADTGAGACADTGAGVGAGAVEGQEEESAMWDNDSGREVAEGVEERKGEEVDQAVGAPGDAADGAEEVVVEVVDVDMPWYQSLTNEETAPLTG